MKCQKSKRIRICPGYRATNGVNVVDGVNRPREESSPKKLGMQQLRNEFDSMRRNAFDSPAWRSRSSSWDSDGNPETVDITQKPYRDPQSLVLTSRLLPTPLDEQAHCFFLANYVLLPRNGSARGYFTFLPALLGLEETIRSPLPLTFSAVAFAAFASQRNARHLLPAAHNRYTKALTEIKTALQDPSRVAEDGTLAAVILMGTFEVREYIHPIRCSRLTSIRR